MMPKKFHNVIQSLKISFLTHKVKDNERFLKEFLPVNREYSVRTMLDRCHSPTSESDDSNDQQTETERKCDAKPICPYRTRMMLMMTMTLTNTNACM